MDSIRAGCGQAVHGEQNVLRGNEENLAQSQRTDHLQYDETPEITPTQSSVLVLFDRVLRLRVSKNYGKLDDYVQEYADSL
ncbi:MAG: hypothetical protein GY832_44285 [Chloroflexi bacterium]|nr:hypothetical protein [Chloroflexota bacterium]